MGIFYNTFKKSALDQIKTSFNFLTSDFHFELIRAEKVENYRADNFLVYRNNQFNIQIEICADENWFHCEIRRIVNGQPANYSDKLNNLSFEDLAILESNHNYDRFDYIVGGSSGLKGVLLNTANLIRRNLPLFTTDKWIDLQIIEDLKVQHITTNFGIIPDKSKPTFFSKIKSCSIKLLGDNGYQLTLDSDEVSPFDRNSMTNKLIFQKENTKIEIAQVDWRDDFFIYQVVKNDTKLFDIDIRHINLEKAAELITNKLKANL
jgi:hypothetical protein